MKERLIAFAQELISKNHYVAFATHDEKYIKRMLAIVEEKKLTNEQIEFQMLLGVPRRKIQREIIERGFTMRLYVPFAEEKKYSIAYLRRRLYENPFMVFSVLRNILRSTFKFGN